MESDNKNNTTTVGGVTFGSGDSGNTPAPTPTQTTPVFGNQQPAAESTAPVPNSPAPAAQPAPISGGNPNDPNAPVVNTLNVPVVSPTSFDNTNTVRPVVKDPNTPVVPEAKQKKKKKSKLESSDHALKKFTTLATVFGVLSAIFFICAIAGLVFALSKSDTLSATEEQLNKANSIIGAVEQSTGVSPIKDVSDVPVYKATTGYIYISEWNIKIKIPDNLEHVSYILNQNYRESICFNAVQKGVQYFPDFANIQLNPGKMGCLTRIATSEGSFDSASKLSFGDLVFTYKDFNYFYTGATDYSNPETDAANLGLEHTAVQIIKNMLTDNVESYE